MLHGYVNLTKNIINNSGYHRKCYQKKITLLKKNSEQYLTFIQNFKVSKKLLYVNEKNQKIYWFQIQNKIAK